MQVADAEVQKAAKTKRHEPSTASGSGGSARAGPALAKWAPAKRAAGVAPAQATPCTAASPQATGDANAAAQPSPATSPRAASVAEAAQVPLSVANPQAVGGAEAAAPPAGASIPDATGVAKAAPQGPPAATAGSALTFEGGGKEDAQESQPEAIQPPGTEDAEAIESQGHAPGQATENDEVPAQEPVQEQIEEQAKEEAQVEAIQPPGPAGGESEAIENQGQAPEQSTEPGAVPTPEQAKEEAQLPAQECAVPRAKLPGQGRFSRMPPPPEVGLVCHRLCRITGTHIADVQTPQVFFLTPCSSSPLVGERGVFLFICLARERFCLLCQAMPPPFQAKLPQPALKVLGPNICSCLATRFRGPRSQALGWGVPPFQSLTTAGDRGKVAGVTTVGGERQASG